MPPPRRSNTRTIMCRIDSDLHREWRIEAIRRDIRFFEALEEAIRLWIRTPSAQKRSKRRETPIE